VTLKGLSLLLDVVGETTISSDTSQGDMFAKERLASSAVVAVGTCLWIISDDHCVKV
jgi:hypothetical protein